jgi:hypothetical protein
MSVPMGKAVNRLLLLMLLTMVDKLANNFPHKARAIGPETVHQALDWPGESVSPPTGRTRRKPNHSSNWKITSRVVSLLTNKYKQFANKTNQDCIKDGFLLSFLCCQNHQAPESSINANVSASEPERSYLQGNR